MYGWLMLLGVASTALVWRRWAREDPRLPVIYVLALISALVGAKVVYLLAEGWRDWGQPDLLRRWATGKSILGGLLFGYVGVELAKRGLGYRAVTGDRFAVVVPMGIGLGRVGCIAQGCCQGHVCAARWYTVVDAASQPRWPAAQVELLFNALALAMILSLRRVPALRGQLFHLYLMAYGLFRFVHEFWRDTPRVGLGLTGYQLAAAALLLLGAGRFWQRAKQPGEAAGTGPGFGSPRAGTGH